nr:hypothetical protein [uncultured Flavobacterium sp.]
MECDTAKVQITQTFNEVRSFSYKRKNEQEILNSFLDKILELQGKITEDTNFVFSLVERFEKLSWIDASNLDEETLIVLNDIISISRDIHRTMIMRFIFLNKHMRDMASLHIKEFKMSIDDLKESINDLEYIHFRIPYDLRFQEINERIQSL